MYQNGPKFSCGLLTINMSYAFFNYAALPSVYQTDATAAAYPKSAPNT
jgi:hypothetical protein